MFGRKKSPLLGIDISSSVVKILELNKKGDKYTVESYAVEPLPINAVVESRIENRDEVAGAIRRAIKRSGTKAKEAAVAVSANSAITKTVTFPSSLSGRELEENVLLEAENYIPYPLEEVRLDFEVLGPSTADVDAVDVLLGCFATGKCGCPYRSCRESRAQTEACRCRSLHDGKRFRTHCQATAAPWSGLDRRCGGCRGYSDNLACAGGWQNRFYP